MEGAEGPPKKTGLGGAARWMFKIIWDNFQIIFSPNHDRKSKLFFLIPV